MALRSFRARYTLHDSTRGELPVLATSSCAAVVVAIDTFGESLRTVSVRAQTPAPSPFPTTPTREASMSDHDELPQPTEPLRGISAAHRPIPFPNREQLEHERQARLQRAAARARQSIFDAESIKKLLKDMHETAYDKGLSVGRSRGWYSGAAFGAMLGSAVTYVAVRYGFWLAGVAL